MSEVSITAEVKQSLLEKLRASLDLPGCMRTVGIIDACTIIELWPTSMPHADAGTDTLATESDKAYDTFNVKALKLDYLKRDMVESCTVIFLLDAIAIRDKRVEALEQATYNLIEAIDSDRDIYTGGHNNLIESRDKASSVLGNVMFEDGVRKTWTTGEQEL